MSTKHKSYNVNDREKVVTPIYDFPVKPIDKTLWQCIYYSPEGTILGRTPKNWGQLGIFYLIFFGILALMFAICMQGLLATLSDDYPKWQLDRSIIGSSPGMCFRPFLNVEDRGSVINYEASSRKAVKQWIHSMNEFLETYTNNTRSIKSKRVLCDFNKPPKAGEVCKFEIDPAFGDCADKSSYGFNITAPCVFLKLKKIYGWVPQYYNNSADLPPEMPEELVSHIKSINDTLGRNQVWVSCKGVRKNTVREIKFVGKRGFPGYFYPFMNLDGYQSPLVPIQIRLKPNQIEENQIVKIECRTWAKNIVYDSSMLFRQGSIIIELAIEL